MFRNIIKYIIILIGVVLMSLILWFGDDAIAPNPTDPPEILQKAEYLQKYIVLPFISLGVVIAVLGLILTLVYYVINLLDNFKPKIIYMSLGMVSIYIIANLLSSGETVDYSKEITPTISRQVGSGIITFYLLIFSAIGAILYTEISKVFSK